MQIDFSEQVPKLIGKIDHNSDLSQLSKITGKVVTVDCSAIEVINSIGVRKIITELKNLGKSLVAINASFEVLDVYIITPSLFGTEGGIKSGLPEIKCQECGHHNPIYLAKHGSKIRWILGKSINEIDPQNDLIFDCQKCGEKINWDFPIDAIHDALLD